MSERVNSFEVIAASAALPGADGAPAWIMLMPAGSFTLRDSRGTFHAGDRAAMERIVARSLQVAGNTELMIDYDHQSVFGAVPKVGGTAPAAGWIKQLEVRDDGIWAQVAWTDAAAAKIRGLEYRYISPFFTHDAAGNVGRLINAALVNMPAIDLTAIAAAMAQQEPADTMKSVAKALGLSDSASEEAILAALTGTFGRIATAAGLKADAAADAIVAGVTALVAAQGQVAVAAGLQAGATAGDVVAAIGRLGTTAGDVVPKASFDQLSRDFSALKTSVETGRIEAAVTAAMDAGKVTPAQKDWATKYASADLAGFESFVANAPVLTGTQLGDGKKPAAGTELDANALAARATAYQAEQAKAGITISYVAAVQHVHGAAQQ